MSTSMLTSFFLRLFLSLMYKSSFADRIIAMEKKNAILACWDYDLHGLSQGYNDLFGKLSLKSPRNLELIRIGSNFDGGYVMANSFDDIETVISLGVGNNVDAELYFAKIGKSVLLYDGTVKRLPKNHKNFLFKSQNVYGKAMPSDSSYKWVNIDQELELIMGHQKEKVSLEVNRNTINAILMVDIEGFEYDVLLSIPSRFMERFQQITVEFHGLHQNLCRPANPLLQTILKLMETHELISVHGNNFGGCINYKEQDFPDVIETTWINRLFAQTEPTTNSLDTRLYAPNNPRQKEIFLKW